MNTKKVYNCYRQGLAWKDEKGTPIGDYEQITVIAIDENTCDANLKTHRDKYVLSSDALTIVESITTTVEPKGISQKSFIFGGISF